MPDCKNCSAPLPPNSLVCAYCGTRNDIDLRGIHEYTTEKPQSSRICPRCRKPLRTVDLKIEGPFLIERCDQCQGMFFDPGELEAVLDKSVTNVYVIDHKRIALMNSQKRHDEYEVSYVKCPVCAKFMNRVNFGRRSGVVVDRCRDHGVWLDGGELRHLMEWTKAGGRMLHQRFEQRRREQEQVQRRKREREHRARLARDRAYANHGGSFYGASTTRRRPERIGDLLDLLLRIVSWC
jgi:Zn-finger nucleic acid-binding protein